MSIRLNSGVPLSKLIDTIRANSQAEIRPLPAGEYRTVPISTLKTGQYQPRRVFSQREIDELADSIRTRGLIQPLLVRPLPDGRFEIVAGERRWRAAAAADLKDVNVIVQDIDDATTLAVTLIENIQRQDLTPIEEADAIERLLTECSLTHEGVARVLSKSREAVSNLLRLRDLHPEVTKLVAARQVPLGHAKVILSAPYERQPGLAQQVAEERLTVRQLEAKVRDLQSGSKRPRRLDSVDAEQRGTKALGLKTRIRCDERGKGTVTLSIRHRADLERFLKVIELLEKRPGDGLDS